MSIIGPPDREPDTLAPGMRWCPQCGVHQYPAEWARNGYHAGVQTGCPVCVDYRVKPEPELAPRVFTWRTNERAPREAS